MENTKLNFINRSLDKTPKDLVIYQENEASMGDTDSVIAWEVIKNCGIDESHFFEFSSKIEVAMGDPFGNYRLPIRAEIGRVMEAVDGDLGGEMRLTNKSTHNPSEFGVLNGLNNGSIAAVCLRNEKLLGLRGYVYPGDTVMFRFSDKINITLASGIEEGEEVDLSFFNEIQAEIDLSGIGSADIVMTGGGEGTDAIPLEFSLENIQRKEFKREQNVPSWW